MLETKECPICKQELGEGQKLCDDCLKKGYDQFIAICMEETGKDPIDILEKLMSASVCKMHGPEHHMLVGASLLTAYHNITEELNLERALVELFKRGLKVPGGICGLWGACGACISTGISLSIVKKASPLREESYDLVNFMTAEALQEVAKVGGPRCCKRNSYLSVLAAVKYAEEKLGVSFETHEIHCTRDEQNKECIKERCPFYKG